MGVGRKKRRDRDRERQIQRQTQLKEKGREFFILYMGDTFKLVLAVD